MMRKSWGGCFLNKAGKNQNAVIEEWMNELGF